MISGFDDLVAEPVEAQIFGSLLSALGSLLFNFYPTLLPTLLH
jgi:hypothetical protein